ncbi:MAG: RdgB/HAM1 family non-canonical purine NTP pyrophosphatase [Tissierellia bacterium]|nr:RdgB/HAM1 family non-canonical purine NTP pyrophosphatase [Tissierellia bacterium]
MKIVIASGNKNKIKEFKEIFRDTNIEFLTPKDFGIDNFEVNEDGDTLKDNSYKKAKSLYDIVKTPTIADDTGLFVKSLDGKPGVKSHRYAGYDANDKKNRKKLLDNLEGIANRNAYFETVISFVDGNDINFFSGRIDGEILKQEMGEGGFGYDSIFKPKDYDLSFSQMGAKEKNKISHRANALRKFREFILDNYEVCNN